MSTFKKNVFSIGLVTAFFVGVVLLVYGNWETISAGRFVDSLEITDRISFFSMSYLASGFFLFVPVLAVLPGTSGICQELSSGFFRYELLRETKKKYIWKTVLSNALGGGLGASISAVPFVIISQFGQPYTIERELDKYYSTESFGWMGKFDTIWEGNLVIIVLILLLFLFGAIWSTYALIFAGFTRNIFATLASPFLTCFFIHVIADQLGASGYSPINMLDGTCTEVGSWTHIAIYQGILLLIFTIGAFFSLRYAVRRDS